MTARLSAWLFSGSSIALAQPFGNLLVVLQFRLLKGKSWDGKMKTWLATLPALSGFDSY